MEFTQQHLDTIDDLVVKYLANGLAKTLEDVKRALDLVVVIRSQETTKADSTDTFLEEIKKIKNAAEKQNKFEPKVPWPENPRPHWDHEGRPYWTDAKIIPLCGAGSGTLEQVPYSSDRGFPGIA